MKSPERNSDEALAIARNVGQRDKAMNKKIMDGIFNSAKSRKSVEPNHEAIIVKTIIQMRREGIPVSEIAKELKVSKSYIFKVTRGFNFTEDKKNGVSEQRTENKS